MRGIRIRIAKWLAPGLAEDLLDSEEEHARTRIERNKYMIALGNIIALETPKCANIGKRMVALAREAVK